MDLKIKCYLCLINYIFKQNCNAMESLITIILKLNKYILKRIDVLNSTESNSRSTVLFQEILKGEFKEDADVTKFLREKLDLKGASNQSNFKKDFKKRVFNTLLFLDPEHEDFDAYQSFNFRANKDFIAIRHLYEMQMSAIATEYAEELLDEVLKYEYTEMAVLLIKYIKGFHALQGDKNKYPYFKNLFHEKKKQFDDELRAREYQELLMIEYVKSAEHKPENSTRAKAYFEELSPFLEKNTSISFQFNTRLIELYQFSTVIDYAGVLDVSERAITFFESKIVKSNIAITTFLGQKMVALMYLKQYDEALLFIDRTIKMRESGSFNWFKSQESKMFLLFRMAHYEAGFTLYNEVKSVKEFKTLDGLNKEMWEMFDIYFHLLHKLGYKIVSDIKNLKPEFNQKYKIIKFQNETETIENDKRGLNIARLAAQICLMIVQKQTKEINGETIKRNLSRYSEKNGFNRRYYLFIKMLLEIPDGKYNEEKFLKNSNNFLNELKTTKNNVIDSIYRTEVIEIENLWDLLIKKIAHKE